MKSMIFLGGLFAGTMMLASCGSGGSPGSAPAVQAENVVTTDTERALLDAINAERAKGGKPPLQLSDKLSSYARGDSDASAAAGKLGGDNTRALLGQSGFDSIGKLNGALKDRGAKTGASFVDYWAKDERAMLLGDWSHVGVGISKSADGRLMAVAIFGGLGGGGMLMR